MPKLSTEEITTLLENELYEAEKKHSPFNSAHEGFSIIKEEVDSLWDEVRHDPTQDRSFAKMRVYAIKIGAMAIRFIKDLEGEKII